MERYERTKQYKAVPPLESIHRARKILYRCGILTAEHHFKYSKPGVSSCRVYILEDGLDGTEYGTNGKGMDQAYSLASAYGEMMERLSNSILFPATYGFAGKRSGILRYAVAPDEKGLDRQSVLRFSKTAAPLLSLTESEYADAVEILCRNGKCVCIPFTGAKNGEKIYIPYLLYRLTHGSNGMCAGNTREEALIQGLSEIYERYACALAYRDSTGICLLDKESFRGTAVYERLRNLDGNGYSTEVLDMSMGRRLPVIGLRLTVDGTQARSVHLGADPNPVTALERCLTEVFQGNADDIKKRFHEEDCGSIPAEDTEAFRIYEAEFSNYITDGSGLLPYCLMRENFPVAESFAYSQGSSDPEDLAYMLDIANECGRQVFIRDASFLSFPAYGILVEGMSVPELSLSGRCNVTEKKLLTAEQKTRNAITQSDYHPVTSLLRRVEQEMAASRSV